MRPLRATPPPPGDDRPFLESRRLLLTSLFWPLLGGLYFALMALDQKHLGEPPPGLYILAIWVEWGVLTPWVIRRALARPPLGADAGSAWWFHLRSLLSAAVGLAVLNNVGRLVLTGRITDLSGSFGGIFLFKLSVATAYGLTIYLTTASLVWFIVMQEQTRGRQLSMARIEAELAGEQLATLKIRLRPDLVVRVLRKLSRLSASDPQAAEESIHRLSDLVREVLSQSRAVNVELSSEVDSFENYVRLLALAAGQNVVVRRRVGGLEMAKLPPRILQLATADVEVTGSARVSIAAVASAQGIRLRVRLAGCQVTDAAPSGRGPSPEEIPGCVVEKRPLADGVVVTLSCPSVARAGA